MNAANDSDLPSDAVRIAPITAAQAVAQYDWLKANYGASRADQWRQELYTTWGSLATLPMRCPAAPEDTEFQQFRLGSPLRAFRYQRDHQSMQPPLDWPMEEV